MEKALCKLMNNVIYRKAMENFWNRIDIRLVNNEKDYLNWTPKRGYMPHKIFNNNLVAICKSKATLILNKPAYIGICILELRKVLMYEFHYDYIKNKCGNNSKVFFTDNDNLLYEIKTDDI